MNVPFGFADRLRVPLIVAPMFLVSNPTMALACSRAGAIGSFPAHTTRTREDFAEWLVQMDEGMAASEAAGEAPAPYAVNLVVHHTNPRMAGDLELCIEHQVPIVLTSKGAPPDVFDRIHAYGGLAFHDVASKRHAEKALEAGADALIAVAGGAGGHCGTINPFALVNEIREITDAPIVLAGGMSHGKDIVAGEAMGACMAYMGTRFIATRESSAPDAYEQALINGAANDVFYTTALDGTPANFLAPSIIEAGFDLDELSMTRPGEVYTSEKSKARYKGIWSAGHGVGATKSVAGAGELCAQIANEYQAAGAALRSA